MGCLVATLYALDSLALIARAQGVISNDYAVFNHLSMVILVGNRVAMSLALPAIGFMIDTGYILSQLAQSYALACLLLSAFYFLYLASPKSLSYPIASAVKMLGWDKLDSSSPLFEKAEKSLVTRTNHKALIAQLFFIFGLCVPSLLAVTYPDFRATLLQTGFFLNSVGTVLNIFFIEKQIARVSRSPEQTSELVGSVRGILQARTLAASIAGLGFLIMGLMT